MAGNKSAMKVVNAFRNGYTLKYGNGVSRDGKLFLFGNLIAKREGGSLWVTNAGWDTQTTNRWLNCLSGVYVSHEKGQLHLNGKKWDGSWINPMTMEKKEVKEDNSLGLIAGIAKLGDILCDSQKEKNDWKKRMLKAGIGEAMDIPADWDQLSEDEKERRLNGAIEVLK